MRSFPLPTHPPYAVHVSFEGEETERPGIDGDLVVEGAAEDFRLLV